MWNAGSIHTVKQNCCPWLPHNAIIMKALIKSAKRSVQIQHNYIKTVFVLLVVNNAEIMQCESSQDWC